CASVSAAITRAPSRANWSSTARPKPLAAPVTIAALFSSLILLLRRQLDYGIVVRSVYGEPTNGSRNPLIRHIASAGRSGSREKTRGSGAVIALKRRDVSTRFGAKSGRGHAHQSPEDRPEVALIAET